MALTATAQNKVADDIMRSLGIVGCTVLKQSFNRPNLHYEVRPKTKGVIKDMVNFIATQGERASGIIYCSSRDKCENLAKELNEKYDLRARHYHAGMSKGDRRKNQEGWQEHEYEIIVATVSCHLVSANIQLMWTSGRFRNGVSGKSKFEVKDFTDELAALTSQTSDVSVHSSLDILNLLTFADVIHHSLPRSLEGYYQETGRAGRDGGASNCILCKFPQK